MTKQRLHCFYLRVSAVLIIHLGIGCASSIPVSTHNPPPPKPKSHHQAALRLLRRVLSINTNTQLGKKIALHRLSQELENYPPIEIYERDTVLVAHLPGQTREPLLLLSHIDTIRWEENQWSKSAGPTSAAIVEGRIVGRGALGGKGAASLMASALIRASTSQNRQRSTYLVVTTEGADPQAHQLKQIFGRHPILSSSYLAITPGGLIIHEPQSGAQPLHLITQGEQGFARILLTAHGFTAGTKLATAINRAHRVLTKPSYTHSAERYLSDLARISPPLTRWLISIKPLAQALYMPELEHTPWTSGMVMSLKHVSYWGRNCGPFVKNDAQAQAWLDVSLPEEQTPSKKQRELRKAVGSLVHVDIHHGETAISDVPQESQYLSVLAKAFGHDQWLRILGSPSQARFLLGIQIPTFGFIPLKVSPQTFATRGRAREHVPTRSVYQALDIFHHALRYLTQSKTTTSTTSGVARRY